jgi:hypothetical protein
MLDGSHKLKRVPTSAHVGSTVVLVAVRFVVPLLVALMALSCISILVAGCGSGISDVCNCQGCSHPYGACPGETSPNWCPGESDGSQPCPCPHPGAMATIGACPGVTYICGHDSRWAAENDAACLVIDAGDAALTNSD